MKNEYKSFTLQEVKSTSEGAGFVEGIGNTLFEVDKYGDIAIDYKGINEFVENGSVYDQHGATDGGEMGDYTIDKQLGTIEEAKAVPNGLYVKWQWHTDSKSQSYKAKIQDKIDRNKNVFLSIGYKLAEPAIYVYQNEFKSKLSEYIPKDKLPAVLKKAEGMQRVRLIVPKVNEITITPNPVNENSMATGYKAEKNSEIEFTKDEFKATFLGAQIIDRVTCGAIDTLWYRAQSKISNLLCPWWDESPNEDEAEEALTVIGIIDEFAMLAKAIYAKMSELETVEPAIQLKAAYSNPDQFEFKGKNVAQNGQNLLKAVEEFSDKAEKYTEYRKEFGEQEVKAGREFSAKNEKQTRTIQTVAKDIEAKAKSISKNIDAMLASLGGGQEVKAELEALEMQSLEYQDFIY